MGIIYDKENRIFQLDTRETSYLIGIVDEEGFVGHIYYGKKIRPQNVSHLLRTNEPPFVPGTNDRERVAFLDTFPMEYPAHGLGDYRESGLKVRNLDGQSGTSLQYISYEITEDKPKLRGLPSSFGKNGECQTLILHCADKIMQLDIDLYYTVFEKEDVITRSVCIRNASDAAVYLEKVMSACIDMDDKDFTWIKLRGSWARERQIEELPLGYGKQSVGSVRGESSHQEHPFIAWKDKHATQNQGEVYGMHFIYSGNFLAQIEKTQFDSIRVVMGIHPEDFCWKLEPGESFAAPEVVLTFSSEGIGGMSRNLHDFYRSHLIRSPYKDKKRPILINNWEATYFDFNTEKLLQIARRAAELGIEMLVMDDGWFGERNDDNSSLGDWVVNEKKITGGLKYLVDEVNKLGLQFGIWVEPEMISPESALYKKHPDWAIQLSGRKGSLCRNQYVLDLSRQEVVDYVYEAIAGVLRQANIAYVKWDMNRQLSDLGSLELAPDRQGELSHRYVMGVYQLQERLLEEFPKLLLENCSGGGARFDPGMLYYSPQIWCSDDTDAIERLVIQEGTALAYPLSAMGAHVSDCPNHTVGRVTPFETRGHVALAGTFGYELDITKISVEEQEMIPKQVEMYHKYNDLVREGDYYRLASFRENHAFDSYMVVAKDKKEALLTYVQVLAQPNMHSRKLRLAGLDEARTYRLESGETFGGDILMNEGLLVPRMMGDYQSVLYHLTAI